MARRKSLDFGGVAAPVRIGGTAKEILHKTVDDGVADLDEAKQIKLELIEPDPDQPRKHFDQETLQDLARSIRLQGVLQPIVVEWSAERERFRIISGERRWRATRLAGELQAEAPGEGQQRDLSRIPAIIRNPSAVDRYLQQVYENEQRQDYSDVERAFAYEHLKEALGLTWDELANKLGLSKGRIHQIRRTKNRLAESVQRDITSGALTGRHGLYLAPLPERIQEIVADTVKAHRLTHQQTKTLIERLKAHIAARPEAARALDMVTAVPVEAGAEESDLGMYGPALAGRDRAEAGESAEVAAAGAEKTFSQTLAANLIESSAISTPPLTPGKGVASYTAGVQEVVAQTVAEVTSPKPQIPRARAQDLDKALALVRQLLRLDLKLPPDAADRAKLAGALDELVAWVEIQRARLSAAQAGRSD